MQRQEIPNNTDEQVREYVVKAMRLADELTETAGQWAPVFRSACELYAGKQVVLMQPQPMDLSHLGITAHGRR